jgi:hypothetical protein
MKCATASLAVAHFQGDLMPRTIAQNRGKIRPDQVIFPIDETAIENGMPADLKGGCYVCALETDCTEINALLFSIRSGEFAKNRIIAPPPWMTGRNKLPGPSTLRKRASWALRAKRWLNANGLGIAEFEEIHVKKFGDDLMAEGLTPGAAGNIQMSLLYMRQVQVWSGSAPPLLLSTSILRGVPKAHPRYGKSFLTNIKQPEYVPPAYIERRHRSHIVENEVDMAEQIAMDLLVGSGLRRGDTEGVRVDAVPRLKAAHPSMPNFFRVIGKGNKARRAEISLENIRRIEHYKIAIRPKRIETFKRLNPGDEEPTALLLNRRNGRPMQGQTVYRTFKRGARVCGIPEARPQWARHAYVADYIANALADEMDWCEQNGVPYIEKLALESIKFELTQRVGHESFITTEGYARNVRVAVREIRLERKAARERGNQ